MHKQPDNVWRIDLQLGQNIDKAEESRPERVIPRIRAFLGQDADFTLDWVSIYTFQCRRMERFRHGRVLFCGDSAHQVSPFGARGANSGVQDADNLGWKLAAVLKGDAEDGLLDSYDIERGRAADENIRHSTRSTDFITPKSAVSRLFRDAVLDLAEVVPATRPLVNSGRLSMPTIYDGSPLNGPDVEAMPRGTRPGSVVGDAPLGDGWLIDRLDGAFTLLTIGANAPDALEIDGFGFGRLHLSLDRDDADGFIKARYLGEAISAVYLIRPDGHVAARWETFDAAAVVGALRRTMGRPA